MTTALLHAHRCLLQDVPVPVPIPLNTIPDLIVPSHIIVPRCSGQYILVHPKVRNHGEGPY